MGILGVSHLGICVSDIDRSLAFYCEQLGFSLINRVHVFNEPAIDRLLELQNVNMELAFIELDHARIELIQLHEPQASRTDHTAFNRFGMTHLSLRVAEFDRVLEALTQAGVSVEQQTLGAHPESNARFVFLADPDGTRIELLGAGDESAPKPWTPFGYRADTPLQQQPPLFSMRRIR